MRIETAEVVFRGTHHNSFRRGEAARVIGVRFVKPEGLEVRLCYWVEYPDGVTDYTPVGDGEHYRLEARSADDLAARLDAKRSLGSGSPAGPAIEPPADTATASETSPTPDSSTGE